MMYYQEDYAVTKEVYTPDYDASHNSKDTASIDGPATQVNHAIELFSEVLAALGPNENIMNNEIIHELYEEVDKLRSKLKLLATTHKDDAKSLDGLNQLLAKIDLISTKYMEKLNNTHGSAPGPASFNMDDYAHIVSEFSAPLAKKSTTTQPLQTDLSQTSIGVSTYDPFGSFPAKFAFPPSEFETAPVIHRSFSTTAIGGYTPNRSPRQLEDEDEDEEELPLAELVDVDLHVTTRSDIPIPGTEEESESETEVEPGTPSTTTTFTKVAFVVPSGPGECPICCDDEVAPADMFILGQCSHQYCKECLQGYFSNKINENKVADISCPHPGCSTVVEYYQVQEVVDGPLFAKYEELAFLASLNSDPTVRWCPRPRCGNAIIGDPENPRSECTNEDCRFEFCFLCSEQWHPNASCEQFQEWLADNGMVDSKFAKWSKKNAKKCPKCKTLIEKMSGCNHMTCGACQYQFCWLCLGKYSSNHFDVFNVLGCPGMQSGSKTFGTAKRLGMRALIGTGLVLGGVVGVALAVPAVVIGGPIYGGYRLHKKRKEAARIKRRYHR